MENADPQITAVAAQLTAVLKEVSDIKSSLAVNTSETGNIKLSVSEIRGDIKDIKNDFVNRREFNDALKTRDGNLSAAIYEINDRIEPLKKFVYGIIGIIGLAVLGAILNLVLKKSA